MNAQNRNELYEAARMVLKVYEGTIEQLVNKKVNITGPMEFLKETVITLNEKLKTYGPMPLMHSFVEAILSQDELKEHIERTTNMKVIDTPWGQDIVAVDTSPREKVKPDQYDIVMALKYIGWNKEWLHENSAVSVSGIIDKFKSLAQDDIKAIDLGAGKYKDTTFARFDWDDPEVVSRVEFALRQDI